jgi:hypothetical protein
MKKYSRFIFYWFCTPVYKVILMKNFQIWIQHLGSVTRKILPLDYIGSYPVAWVKARSISTLLQNNSFSSTTQRMNLAILEIDLLKSYKDNLDLKMNESAKHI